MRNYLLVLISCFFVVKSFGQYNYYRLSAGVNVGSNVAFADLEKKRPAQTITANLNYHLTPFTTLGLEYQNGSLAGGDKLNDPHFRYFKNSYSSFTLGGQVQLGQVVDFESNNFLYAIRGLYMGLGVGMIKNNVKDVVRLQPPNYTYEFPGKDKSSGIVVPISTGMNFNILDRWGYTRYIFNVGYQFSVTTGEGLDGYNDASKGGAFSNIPDMYGVVSVGVKVCFGPEGLY